MAIPSDDTPMGSAPRKRTLLTLATAVLLIHLWGLGVNPLPSGGSAADGPLPAPQGPAAAATTEPAPTPASAAGSPPATPVDVTRVRWIAPAPEPAARVPAPRQAATPRPAPPRPAVPVALPADDRPVAATPESPAAPEPAATPLAETTEPGAEALLAQAEPAAGSLQAEAQVPAPTESPAAAPPPAPAPPPSEPPPSARLSYDIEGVIRGLTYRASGTLDWTLAGGRYAARTEISMLLVGTRVQTSEGAVGPEGLMPERFSDKRRTEVATHFERGTGRIRFSGNAPEVALMPGAQDRLSLFMQIAGLLQARPHQAGDVIEFQVAGTGDAEPWRFEVGELQDLDLPAGTVTARWVRRLPRKPHDSTVEVWLAPSMKHLPVRLRISQANGDVADQRLARLP